MSKEAAKTAYGPTLLIAIEQFFPSEQRIVEDDIAYRVLSPIARAFVQLMRPTWARNFLIHLSETGQFPGMWGGMLCRKRYIDDTLAESASDVDAVVNLGAGLDTRAYRPGFPTGMPMWEVDLPEVIEQKRAGLLRAMGSLPPNVRLVSIDFDHENVREVLQTHGYSTESRTFFILEGVTQYVTEKGLQATFDFLARVASGSQLVFTYVRKDFIDERDIMHGWEKAHKKYVGGGIWLQGLEPQGLAGFLASYGWRLAEDLGYEELTERYIKPTGRKFATTTVERIALAEKL